MKAETTQAGGGLNHRIDVYLVTHGQTQRELVEIGGNDYGDIVLIFAEGDKIQFTPREKGLSVPTVESVKGLYQNKVPRLSSIRIKGDVVWGDLRIIPTPEHAEQGQSGTGKQTRKPRVEWSSNAQDRVANIWKDWKGCHNTQETGGREIDCYNENKADMPDTVKTFADFRACKECARKNRRIPKYNRKRRKTAG